MPNDNTGVDPQPITPAGETPAGTDVVNKPSADTLQAQLEETRKALKAANAEAADRRKKLQAFEEAETARKEAEMTEVEKANAKLAEMVAEHDALKQTLRDNALNAAIDLQAKTLNFRNTSDARARINRDALEYGDDEKWSGVEEALQALAKDSPYLIESKATPANTDGRRRNTENALSTSEALEAEIKARYGFQG